MRTHMPSPPFKGGEGGDPPRCDGEGEVGGRPTRLVGPPHLPDRVRGRLSPPGRRGGEEKI
jgi:hypothetical protein